MVPGKPMILMGAFHRVWTEQYPSDRPADPGKLVRPTLGKSPAVDFFSGKVAGYLWACCFDRSVFDVVGNFDPRLQRLQDFDLFIRCTEYGIPFKSIVESGPVAVYRKSDSGVSPWSYLRSWYVIRRKHRIYMSGFGLRRSRQWHRHHLRVALRISQGSPISTLGIAFLIFLNYGLGRFRRIVYPA